VLLTVQVMMPYMPRVIYWDWNWWF